MRKMRVSRSMVFSIALVAVAIVGVGNFGGSGLGGSGLGAFGFGAFGFGAMPAQAAGSLIFFQSPSGNAHCAIDTEDGSTHFASCELASFTGKPPARPSDCDLDWVPGASVSSSGRVSVFGCQGDTMRSPDNPKLAYGKSIKRGEFTCTSAQIGITCKVKSGRGFLVSRAVIKKL